MKNSVQKLKKGPTEKKGHCLNSSQPDFAAPAPDTADVLEASPKEVHCFVDVKSSAPKVWADAMGTDAEDFRFPKPSEIPGVPRPGLLPGEPAGTEGCAATRSFRHASCSASSARSVHSLMRSCRNNSSFDRLVSISFAFLQHPNKYRRKKRHSTYKENQARLPQMHINDR